VIELFADCFEKAWHDKISPNELEKFKKTLSDHQEGRENEYDKKLSSLQLNPTKP
jgi:hypothetical protein